MSATINIIFVQNADTVRQGKEIGVKPKQLRINRKK